MQFRTLLVLLVLLSFSLTGKAQSAAVTTFAAQPPPEMIALRQAGYAANYNLDYTTARARFEEIRKRWPQHPAGDLYAANIIWLEHLYKLRRLQTGGA